MDDGGFKYAVTVAFASAVLISGMIVGCTVHQNKVFVEGGYSMGTVPGHSNTVWIKQAPEEKK